MVSCRGEREWNHRRVNDTPDRDPRPGLVCASGSRPIGSRCPAGGHSGHLDRPGEFREARRRRDRARIWLHRGGACEALAFDSSAKLECEIASRARGQFSSSSCCGMPWSPAPMRTRFDQFGKQMVRTALETRGPVETDAEVPADTAGSTSGSCPIRRAGRCPITSVCSAA